MLHIYWYIILKNDDLVYMYSFYPNVGRSFEPLSQEGKIAVASSVTVFAVTSILFFIVGFLSGHFCRKERKRDVIVPSSQEIQTPYYDDIVLKQHIEQELELKDNVAYAPVQL